MRLLSHSARAVLLALVCAPAPARAHDIPADVTALVFVHPARDRLQLLVRVPLEAMRDITFPQRGNGFLDVARAQPKLHEAAGLWILDFLRVQEDGRDLSGGAIVALRASLPADVSFSQFEAALEHVRGPPLSPDIDLPWQQAMLDVLIEYPIRSRDARFSINPSFAHLGVRTNTIVRLVVPNGEERVFQFHGNPGLVHLDPRWHQAALTFVKLGFLHILGGIDHLLFVLCLLIPFRQLRPLVLIVTAFTIAHSITLVLAALGWAPGALWFPTLIETLIAASILFMALENIIGAQLQRRWAIAFGFGLVHGFGFSFALRDSLQLAGSHLATSLFAFNVGVELGQVLVLLLAVPLLDLLLRRLPSERVAVIILSALIAHTAWHWLLERGGELRAYRFEWPVLDAAFWAGALRLVMTLLIAWGAGWLVRGLYLRLKTTSSS